MPSSSGDVIYLPSERRETLSSDLGGLLGAVIGSTLRDTAQKKQKEEAMQFVEGVRKAPDRASAFEVLNNYSPKFRTPADYTNGLRIVDEMHPVSMETPTPTTAYDPNTGATTTAFPNRKQMVDPSYWKNSGLTLTKPEVEDFYKPVIDPAAKEGAEPAFVNMGRAPITSRPEGGLTLKEIELGQKGRAETRADKRLSDSEKRQAAQDQRYQDSIARSDRTMGAVLQRLTDTEGVQAQNTMKSARQLLALTMNAKALPDGTFDFGGDENKKEEFMKQLDHMSARVEANPGMLKGPTAVERLVSDARKAVVPDKPKGDTPKAAAAVSTTDRVRTKAQDIIDGVLKKDDPVKMNMSTTERQQSLESAKAAAIRVRNSDMSVPEKKKQLQSIRDKLKAAGINEGV